MTIADGAVVLRTRTPASQPTQLGDAARPKTMIKIADPTDAISSARVEHGLMGRTDPTVRSMVDGRGHLPVAGIRRKAT